MTSRLLRRKSVSTTSKAAERSHRAAKRGMYYHGTSITNLRSVLSQGLIPQVKTRRWDTAENDKGNYGGRPSLASYGGVYCTQNLLTALSAPSDCYSQGRMLLVCMDLQPNTFYLDEDNIKDIFDSPLGGLSTRLHFVGMAIIMATLPVSDEIKKEADQYKKDYVDYCLSRIEEQFSDQDRSLHPQLKERIKPLVEELWLVSLMRHAAYIFWSLQQDGEWDLRRCYTQIMGKDAYDSMPAMDGWILKPAQAEAAFRKHVEQLTRTLRTLGKPDENGGTRNSFDHFRVDDTIGYSGSNRITAVLEVPRGDRARREDGVEVIVHYGAAPSEFARDYTKTMGSQIRYVKPGSPDPEEKPMKEASGSTTYYHGSHQHFSEFKSRTKAVVGLKASEQPIFLTQDEKFARLHAEPRGWLYAVEGDVGRCFRGTDILDFNERYYMDPATYKPLGKKLYAAIADNEIWPDGASDPKGYIKAIAAMNWDCLGSPEFHRWLKDEGYNSYAELGDGPENVAVFDPSRLRIVAEERVGKALTASHEPPVKQRSEGRWLPLSRRKSVTAREQEITSTDNKKAEEGYWAGDDGSASGILAIASDTKHICLAWRNDEVHQGDCWGLIGGAVKDGMSPGDSAKAEMEEEVGYDGECDLHATYVFTDGDFTYHNFIGVVPSEFPLSPHSSHAWETDSIEWSSLEDIEADMEEHPEDYHPGVIKLFEESGHLIKKLVENPKGEKTSAKTVDTEKQLVDYHPILTELMQVLQQGLPAPSVLVVNTPNSNWTGKCSHMPGEPNTRIELQRYMCFDEKSLRRTLAHELAHHEDSLVNDNAKLEELGVQDYIKWSKRQNAHGPAWQAIANRFNAKYGEGFVTEFSDKTGVRHFEETNPSFVNMVRWRSGQIAWQHATRITPAMRKSLVRAYKENGDPYAGLFKLFVTTDSFYMRSATIGSLGQSKPSNPEEALKAEQLFASGTDLLRQAALGKLKTPAKTAVKASAKVAADADSYASEDSALDEKRRALGFRQDNPLVKYGEDEREQALEWLRRHPRTTTAWYWNVSVPTAVLAKLPGKNREHLQYDEELVERLADSMKEEGFKPGNQPLVIVEADGRPFLYEGNHRVQAARRAGIEEIVVEVKYHGGSEMIERVWDPVRWSRA